MYIYIFVKGDTQPPQEQVDQVNCMQQYSEQHVIQQLLKVKREQNPFLHRRRENPLPLNECRYRLGDRVRAKNELRQPLPRFLSALSPRPRPAVKQPNVSNLNVSTLHKLNVSTLSNVSTLYNVHNVIVDGNERIVVVHRHRHGCAHRLLPPRREGENGEERTATTVIINCTGSDQ